jgi:TRAP transporter TAXI family solute receptor
MPKLTRVLIALAALVVLVVCVVAWYTSRETLPPEVRVAAGKKDGLYDTFAQQFAKHLQKRTGRPVRVIETPGTEVNVGLLRDGGADLAIIQSDSLTPNDVVGIAPLFPELVHIIAREKGGIHSVADLKRTKNVALGSVGSGMRQNALTVLAHYDIQPANLHDVEEPFAALDAGTADAVFVTTGWMNPLLMQKLKRRDLVLVGIADNAGLATRHPWFTATTIPRGLYPGEPPVPGESVPTVAVTALLAARADASNRLVDEALAALYETDLRASFPAALTAKAAQDYDATVMHPEAAHYHNPYAGLNRVSGVMDFFSKSKEVLVAVAALGFLLWNWARFRREKAAAAADQIQRQQLEGFIRQTLDVELEQMEVYDPEALRPFLQRVTLIKQHALRELTREKVLGDQLFAIFLAQCAALSDKILMRMMYRRFSDVKETAALPR